MSFYLLTYRLLEILNLSEFRSGTPQTIGKEEVTFLDVIPSEFRRKFADRKRAICLSCDIHIVFSPDEVKDLRIVRGEYDACSIWVGILIIKQLQDHVYHLFVEMIFQFIYDQVTTCSEDRESPADQSMSFDRSGRNNPVQLDRISGLKIVDDIFRVRGWSAAKPILCDLPYSDRTEYYSARYSIRNSNE